MDDVKRAIDKAFHHHHEPPKGRDEDDHVYCCDDLGWVREDQAHEHRADPYRKPDVFADSGEVFKEIPRA